MFSSSATKTKRLVRACAFSFAVSCAPFAHAGWEPRNSGTTSALTSVQCLSSTSAWAVGVGGVVLHSDDGGDTWTSIDSGVPSGLGWNSVHFVTPASGWLSGVKAMGRTADTGGTWSRFLLGDSLMPVVPAMNAIHAISETEAWSVGVAYGEPVPGVIVDLLTLWRFRVDGNTLNVLENQLIAQGTFTDVQFLTADDGFAVGGTGAPQPDGIIARITNASTDAEYDKQESGGGFYLEGISMVDLQRGWIVGDGGIILHTVNGGGTWMIQPSGTVATLMDVFFLNDQRGWAVGGGALLETGNGGGDWIQSESAPDVDLYSVHFCSADHGFAVGEGGTMLEWVPNHCGDELVDAAEECDLGEDVNGQAGTCCAVDCTIAEIGSVCRTADGECDVPEVCSGVSVSCPADELLAAGVVCRAAANDCDVDELCTGRVKVCPADQRAALGTSCDDGDPCTIEEACGAEGCGGGEAKCVSDDACLEARCQPANGACLAIGMPDGEPCPGGVCEGGSCKTGTGEPDAGAPDPSGGAGGDSDEPPGGGARGGSSTTGGEAGEHTSPGSSPTGRSAQTKGCGSCSVGAHTEGSHWPVALGLSLFGLLGLRRRSRP